MYFFPHDSSPKSGGLKSRRTLFASCKFHSYPVLREIWRLPFADYFVSSYNNLSFGVGISKLNPDLLVFLRSVR